MAWRGVLVRRLVMPDHPDDTRDTMHWLVDKLGKGDLVKVMGHDHPCGDVRGSASVSRRLSSCESRGARGMAREAGRDRSG